MGLRPRIRAKRPSFTPSIGSQSRSLFATRPFAPPETEATEAETDTSVQRQGDRSTPPSLGFVNIPLFSPTPAPASANPSPTFQRQELAELDEEEDAPIQAKLTVGAPNDPYEQEADRVAAEVVNQISTPPSAPIQREETPEEELQTKPLAGSIAPLVQREEKQEEDLQMMPVQRVAEAGEMEASPDLESSIAQAKGGGQPLNPSIREPIERAMKADFSGVKVHTDAQADQLNRSVQARAFTTGQDVFFRQGEYNPGSRGGQELIAHELTHVVQQNGNSVHRSTFEEHKVQEHSPEQIQLLSIQNLQQENLQPNTFNDAFEINFRQYHLIDPFDLHTALAKHKDRWETYGTKINTVINMTYRDALYEIDLLLLEIDNVPNMNDGITYQTSEKYDIIETKFSQNADREWLLNKAGAGNWIEIDDLTDAPGRAIYVQSQQRQPCRLGIARKSNGMQIYHYG